MGTPLRFTQAKASLSDVYDDVERAGLRVIVRHKSVPLALLRQDELAALLAEQFPFSTRTSRSEDGMVSIWLEELSVYGRGGTIAEAVEDLLDEVELYLEEWEHDLHRAPNHAARRWWVHRAQLAQGRDQLRDVLFVPATP